MCVFECLCICVRVRLHVPRGGPRTAWRLSSEQTMLIDIYVCMQLRRIIHEHEVASAALADRLTTAEREMSHLDGSNKAQVSFVPSRPSRLSQCQITVDRCTMLLSTMTCNELTPVNLRMTRMGSLL